MGGGGGQRHIIGAELETVFCAFFNSLKGWFFSLGGEKEKANKHILVKNSRSANSETLICPKVQSLFFRGQKPISIKDCICLCV